MVLPFWVKPLAVLLLVGALFGGWRWRESVVYDNGYSAAVAERRQRDDEQLTLAMARTQATERALRERMDADSLARQNEKAKYEKTIDALRLKYSSGTGGLRAPGTCIPAATTGPDSGAAGGPGGEAGSVALLPETTSSVLDAAVGLRNSVRDRNALIDLYEQARTACNAK